MPARLLIFIFQNSSKFTLYERTNLLNHRNIICVLLGEKSHRNTTFGCAFIQEFSRIMREKSHMEHMSDISIAVSCSIF